MFNEYGLMELAEVVIRNNYQILENDTLTVIIEAGENGYSIIFSNYEIAYEDHKDTPFNNLQRAIDNIKNEYNYTLKLIDDETMFDQFDSIRDDFDDKI